MIADLKPYPAYKDSGVEWLGEVPAHWTVTTLGHIGQIFKGNGGSKEDEVSSGIPCVRYGDLYTKYEFFIRKTGAFVSPEQASAYTPIRYGDVLFAASGETIEDIGRSAVNLIETDACCGGDILVLRPAIEVIPHFLGFVADAPASRHQKACVGRGFTVAHIYGSELKRLALPLPPLPEQVAIVRFLDYVDQRIRRSIRARKRRIELLEEYKQALIHEAVTGRIDVRTGKPYPAYKDSGVEWLGEVPEHWEVVQLARCIDRIDQGWSPVAAEGKIDEIQWVVLTLSAVRRGRFDSGAVKPIPTGSSIPPGIELSNGDLLITRSNTLDRVGDVCIAEGVRPRTILCDLVYRLRLRNILIDARFLMELLLSRVGRNQIEQSAQGSSGTMPKISQQRMRSWRIPLPTLVEQQSVAAWLDDNLGTIDTAITATQREITLLNELRTRLISDVVTGKLDVREVAARLPEEDEEPEPLDGIEDDLVAEKPADGPNRDSEEARA